MMCGNSGNCDQDDSGGGDENQFFIYLCAYSSAGSPIVKYQQEKETTPTQTEDKKTAGII
jgi:hypothetical protein